MRKIFVVGSINTDLVIKAPYTPQKGETLTGGGLCKQSGVYRLYETGAQPSISKVEEVENFVS